MIPKLITGGQTGADQGALRAAKALGIPTGGVMPRNFWTEVGPAQAVAETYGLIEHFKQGYAERTLLNIASAKRVFLFGSMDSPGTRRTARFAAQLGLPTYFVQWSRAAPAAVSDVLFRQWIEDTDGTLMIAGNRESVNPGIGDAIFDYLLCNLAGAKLPCS